MNNKQQIHELIKAQNILRSVYAEQSAGDVSEWLRSIDKEFSKVINIIGGMNEDNKNN